ncbi:MAG: hypothetical protein JO171_04245 [Paludibacterium sp.]|uniref:hypothetical protein n=1 Tax=Paludibacterium sp. TaxID=1917523 RepID=UPI0025CD24C9|nr:hypothetical protein [Paludibacterium sp.]MBV8046334.1 hypothetical protein [Paludibacterium sp.]MBV8649550.1 hypothetical protein [Paludibacterium sp.]
MRALCRLTLPLLLAWSLCAGAADTQTLVFMRHAEKPADDLGQLSCQGLNRALALPPRLQTLFGRPDFLFAPNPGVANHGYSYVRPLATLEPTAIALAKPVDTRFGYNDVAGLLRELDQPRYRRSMIWIAWEHKMIEKALKQLSARYAPNGAAIAPWPGKEFDRLAVVTLTRDGDTVRMDYRQQQQDLNGLSPQCP